MIIWYDSLADMYTVAVIKWAMLIQSFDACASTCQPVHVNHPLPQIPGQLKFNISFIAFRVVTAQCFVAVPASERKLCICGNGRGQAGSFLQPDPHVNLSVECPHTIFDAFIMQG